MIHINKRPRRNRKNASMRALTQETNLSENDLIMPLFIIEGQDQRVPINSMPGQFRLGLNELKKEVTELWQLGIKCVSIFPAVDESLKTSNAEESYNPNGLNQQAIKLIKDTVPDMLVMTDIALDPYSSDGHDGLVDPKTGEILNDQTLEVLAKMAICQAQAGSDIVGPSDMMDGRVAFIRKALDECSFKNTNIMSYTAKYASGFYGPFRDALDSAPKKGDKKTYQMNPANIKEAILETKLDEEEGADILMVKPGLPYLDVLREMRNHTDLPLAAYNVSGEYAMIKAAAEKGWLDERTVVLEMLMSFKRAGADMILSYFSKQACQYFQD